MKIQIITLLDCQRCATLKKELSNNDISFTSITCEEDSSKCDSLESLLGIENYPIVLVNTNDNSLLEILYLPNAYEELGKTKIFDSGVIGIPQYSIENMVHYIKNRLY